MSDPSGSTTTKKSFLPAIGSWKYHLLLGSVAILILGPLGGITASYMNFSLGFFVGGQVLAGILGSVITYGYGAEGKHGANFMQTMAASVASMAAMGVLIQTMYWLHIDPPEAWKLVVYFLCIGMFGVGVGMLFTPILVDRLQLTYPSGLAVANILRALTDKRLLKRSVTQLGTGTVSGILLALGVDQAGENWPNMLSPAKIVPEPFQGALVWLVVKVGKMSVSSIGAGLVVGARITIPALVVGFIGEEITPYLLDHGYLHGHEHFRKAGFLVALGSIMGAAIVDLALIFYSVVQRVRAVAAEKTAAVEAAAPGDEWKQTSTRRLLLWTAFWGTGVVLAAVFVMKLPVGYVLFAVVLVLLFVIINGISTGVSDSNPISSAFVVTVLLMSVLGLTDQRTGLLCGAILLVAVSVGVDMQQDRSTGWRLGSNRVTQFRYQVIGITMGAVMAVVTATIFMKAYPILKDPNGQSSQWQSAMTYKFSGVLSGLGTTDPKKTFLLELGLGLGFGLELIRKIVKNNAGWKRFVKSGPVGFVVDFCFDAFFVPSPYAASFGGFVEFATTVNFGVGGILGSLWNTVSARRAAQTKTEAKKLEESKGYRDAPVVEEDLPEDMSTTSLVGGGLIAGESIAALATGIIGLLALLK